MPGVVGEGREGLAEPLVASPPEAHVSMFARGVGHGAKAAKHGHLIGVGVGFATVAPLGEHLGCVDLTGPWQGCEDLRVRVLTEVGDDRSLKILDRGVERAGHSHQGPRAGRTGLGLDATEALRRATQASQELGRGTVPAVVGLLQEGGQVGLGEAPCRCRGRVALEEGQGDLRGDIGKNHRCSGPIGLQGGPQLVAQGNALVDELPTSPHRRSQRPGLGLERLQTPQTVPVGAGHVGDDVGVASVGLGSTDRVAPAKVLHGEGRNEHDGIAGLEDAVDQATLGSLDPDQHLGTAAEASQAANESLQTLLGVEDRRWVPYPPGVIDDAQVVRLGRPVDADEHCNLLWSQGSPGDESTWRVITDWRSRRVFPLPLCAPGDRRRWRYQNGPPRAMTRGLPSAGHRDAERIGRRGLAVVDRGSEERVDQ